MIKKMQRKQSQKHFIQGITIVPKFDTGFRTSGRARKVA